LNAAPLSSQSPSPGRAQQHPTTSPISALIALVKKHVVLAVDYGLQLIVIHCPELCC